MPSAMSVEPYNSSSVGSRRWPLLSVATAAVATAGLLFIGLKTWKAVRRRKNNVSTTDHSIPLPRTYTARRDYSRYDLLVLFPSTIEAEREKHYEYMREVGLPGAEAFLLSPQDAQKKACTIGLDDSQIELQPALQLLKMKSINYLHVSLDSYRSLFASYTPDQKSRTLVLNLCDGTELDGIPGLSVLRHLQTSAIAYTGADEDFFIISTYKQRMKRAFEERGVETSPWSLLPKKELEEWKGFREKEEKSSNEDAALDNSTNANSISTLTPEQRRCLPPRISPFESTSFSSTLKELLNNVRRLPYPLLVKPDDSYCSCGITTRAVCWSAEEVLDYASEICSQFSAIYVEQFVKGREFTVLVSGRGAAENTTNEITAVASSAASTSTAASSSSSSVTATPASTVSLAHLPLNSLRTNSLRVYSPIERVFDSRLPYFEQFISYELFWEIAREATAKGEDEFIFRPVPKGDRSNRIRKLISDNNTSTISINNSDLYKQDISLIQSLQEEALKAYISVGGCGYARVDIREEHTSGKLKVLEVNANCGITQYKQTAMGEILRESKTGFHELLDTFFDDALRRRGV